MIADLLELVYQHDELALCDATVRREALGRLFAHHGVEDVEGAVTLVSDEIDGFGPLTALMTEAGVTDILVDGPDAVWVDRGAGLVKSGVAFESTEHLMRWCERVMAEGGTRIDWARPISDARLRDGSRVHAVLPPIAPHGPLVSIRRFSPGVATLDDLVELGTLDPPQASLLRTAVEGGDSIVISGATGAGKTTLLGALLGACPSSERVIVIEELPELDTSHHVSLVGRSSGPDGRGEVSLGELVTASLRMRPDRIIVGEVRGPEAGAAFHAMATGHRGTMLTVHASSTARAKRRLVELALLSKRSPSERALALGFESSVDLWVQLERIDGRRRIVEITSG